MRLYIANVTAQIRGLSYRDAFNATPGIRVGYKAPRRIDVPPGRQLQIGGDGNLPQLQEIIRQLTPFGLYAVTDIPRLKASAKVVLIWNFDRPVPQAVMRAAKDHNQGVLADEGRRRRMMAAVAANEALIGQVASLNETADPAVALETPREVTVEMELDDKEVDDDRKLSEGFRVGNDGKGGPAPPQAPRSRSRRNARAG